ncbi:MAG: rhodanese-like domain-containing protein, partial [Nitrospirales bacterium]
MILRKNRWLVSIVCCLNLGLIPICFAAQPYVLNVQQVQAGLAKAPHPSQKGFVLIDVRTPEEHQEGFIPGTDFNIDYRELQQRYRDIEATVDD